MLEENEKLIDFKAAFERKYAKAKNDLDNQLDKNKKELK